MRKFIIKFLALTVAIMMCIVPALSAGASRLNEGQLIQGKIENAIVLFYENKDIGAKNNFSEIMDKDITEYLYDKITVERLVAEKTGLYKENYSLELNLINKEITKDYIEFKFQVIRTCNYTISKDIDSVLSEEVIICYDLNKALITDFYTPFNSYDIAIRGENRKELSGIPYETRKERLNNLLDDINSEYEYKATGNLDSKTNAVRVVPNSRSSLNHSNIVSYARDNFNKVQPNSGNGTIPYFDFSTISGAHDCTNFVSHALIAGGAGIYDTGASGITTTGWYYRDTENRSTSWTIVSDLHTYLINNTHSGCATGFSNSYTNYNGGYWGLGDVMQFKPQGGSKYTHSAIITAKSFSADGTIAYAYVTGRTSSWQNNDNEPADTMFSGGNKRTIYVFNY